MSPQKPRNTFHSLIKAQMKMSQLAGRRAVSQPLQAPGASPDGSAAQTPQSREREEPAHSAAPSPPWFLPPAPTRAGGDQQQHHSHRVPPPSPGVTAPSSGHTTSCPLSALGAFLLSLAPTGLSHLTCKSQALLMPSAMPGHLPSSSTVPQPLEVTWG